MADGFTILPEFGNSQGANTAVLPENNQVLDTYFKIQENKYRDKLFNYKKADDEARARAQALNFDTGEVWQQDKDKIHGMITGLIDFAHDNPDFYDTKSDAYKEYDKRERGINFLINKSKHDKSIYDEWLNKGATDPNFQDDFEIIKGNLDSFKGTDVDTRNWTPIVPPPTFNPYEAWNDVSEKIDTTQETKEGKDLGGNNLEYITQDIYDPEKRTQAIEMIWDNNIKRTAQHITRDYNSLPPDAPEKKQFPTARDYGIHIMDKTFPTVKKSTTAIKPRKFAPSSGGSGSPSVGQTVEDRYNFIKEGVTTNPANLSAALITGKYNGGTITSAEVVDVKPETISTVTPLAGKSLAVPISNKDAVPQKMITFKYEKTNSDGAVSVFDGEPILLTPENDYGIQPINNILNQVGEGTKNYVSPEQIRSKYKQDNLGGGAKQQAKPKTLSGKINTSELVVGNEYIVNGSSYIWDGKNLNPK